MTTPLGRLTCLISILLIRQVAFGQQSISTEKAESVFTEDSFSHIIGALANDSMGGRYAGSKYELKAKQFIINYLDSFIQNDYTVTSDTFTFCCRDSDSVAAHNIFAHPKVQNKKNIILAAHYDHLPPGSKFSKEIWNKNSIHPGADDNASGVALALILFKNWYLHKDSSDFNIILVLFSGHEEGLFGSKHWAETHLNPADSIILMYNFDMVGRMSDETRILSSRTNKNNLQDTLLTSTALNYGIKLVLSNENAENTDSRHFQDKTFPAFSFTTGIHNDYHRISDTPDKINYAALVKMSIFFSKYLSVNF